MVVDEYRCGTADDEVRVNAVDRDVVDSLLLGLVLDRRDLDPGSGSGLQPHSGPQVLGRHPRAGVRQPESVVACGDDLSCLVIGGAVGVDGDGVQLLDAVTRDEGRDGANLAVTGLDIGGDHLVTDLDVLDRLRGTVRQQDPRAREEAVAVRFLGRRGRIHLRSVRLRRVGLRDGMGRPVWTERPWRRRATDRLGRSRR